MQKLFPPIPHMKDRINGKLQNGRTVRGGSRGGQIWGQVPAAPPREQATAGPGGWPGNVMGRGGAVSGPVTRAVTPRGGSGSPWGAPPRGFPGCTRPPTPWLCHSPRFPHPADDLGP